jgi:hypothetical protein
MAKRVTLSTFSQLKIDSGVSMKLMDGLIINYIKNLVSSTKGYEYRMRAA